MPAFPRFAPCEARHLPEAFYNIKADLPEPPPPALHPGTRQPLTADDWAPVFSRGFIAHELTHAFVREAFGAAENRALSEGFAEYLASRFYGAEVNRDIHAASAVVIRNPKLMPYVTGFDFCQSHVEKPGFAKFFESQIVMPDFGPGHLANVWKRLEAHA